MKKYKPDISKSQKEFILEEFRKGKRVSVISREMKINDSSIYKFLKNPELRDSLSTGKRTYSINQSFLDKIDTPEKAYFLGWAVTDGYNNQKNGFFAISLQERDGDVLRLFLKWFESEAPLKFLERSKKNPNWQNQIRFRFSSRILSNKLAEWGCPQAKTFNIRWPEWLPENLWRYYIKGVYEGDGGLTKSLSIVGTENLCEGICKVIESKLGISAKIYKTNSQGIVRLALNRQDQIKKFLDWIYEDSTFHLNRKYNQYLEFNNFIINVSTRLFNEDGTLFSEEQKKERKNKQKMESYHRNKVLSPRRFLINEDGTPFTGQQRIQRRHENEKRYRDKKKGKLS